MGRDPFLGGGDDLIMDGRGNDLAMVALAMDGADRVDLGWGRAP
jgi:hypothetical protein